MGGIFWRMSKPRVVCGVIFHAKASSLTLDERFCTRRYTRTGGTCFFVL